MRKGLICAFGAVAVFSQTAWAEPSAGEAVEALSTWLAWIIGYLGLGALLMAIATAASVREHRAWAALLRWDDGDANDEEGESGDPAGARRNRAA